MFVFQVKRCSAWTPGLRFATWPGRSTPTSSFQRTDTHRIRFDFLLVWSGPTFHPPSCYNQTVFLSRVANYVAQLCFFKYWHETIYQAYKLPPLQCLKHQQARIGTRKRFNFNAVGERRCLPWGSNLAFYLHSTFFGEQLFLASFFWLSWRPGIVAAWYDHPKSRPVRCGRHFLVWHWPILRLFFDPNHPARLTVRCHCARSIV